MKCHSRLPRISCRRAAVVTVRRRTEQQQRALVVALRTAPATQRTQARRLRAEARPFGMPAATARRNAHARCVRPRGAPLPMVVLGGGGGGRRPKLPATIVIRPVPVGDVQLLQGRLHPQLMFAQHGRLVDLLQLILRWLKLDGRQSKLIHLIKLKSRSLTILVGVCWS